MQKHAPAPGDWRHINLRPPLYCTAKHRAAVVDAWGKVRDVEGVTRRGCVHPARHSVGRNERDDDHGGRAHCGKTIRMSTRLNEVARILTDGTITARIRSTVELDGVGQMLEKLRERPPRQGRQPAGVAADFHLIVPALSVPPNCLDSYRLSWSVGCLRHAKLFIELLG